ncbi:hypothetical protein DV515_00012348 [Chloebia gouldiae]|uniref:Uncharacterized protein n=1 Tax=Chloebia gouldiae TaxID=44316 RepID=A0A3L8S4Z0_CHLGU|nr:hypothetical protein DV515_00012348 [Chloebia gouldiae]
MASQGATGDSVSMFAYEDPLNTQTALKYQLNYRNHRRDGVITHRFSRERMSHSEGEEETSGPAASITAVEQTLKACSVLTSILHGCSSFREEICRVGTSGGCLAPRGTHRHIHAHCHFPQIAKCHYCCKKRWPGSHPSLGSSGYSL